jgi:integrase/recombinase XerD
LKITLSDIDFGSKILKIDQPKQNNYRSIPISSDLQTVLKRLMKKAGSDGRLIPLTGSALYNRFKRAALKTDLKRNVRLHSLRHTFGTWLASHGAAQRNLQDLMGHSNPQTTSIYTHPVADSIRRDMNLLHLPRKKKKKP